MAFKPNRYGLFTFYFGEAPALESSWCSENCPLNRVGRCCACYRPRFTLFELILLYLNDIGRFNSILGYPNAVLNLETPHLGFEAKDSGRICSLWTPVGCTLPPALRPATCRSYFCRSSVFSASIELHQAYHTWAKTLRAVQELHRSYSDWATGWAARYRRLNKVLTAQVGSEVNPANNIQARKNLLSFMCEHQAEFESHRRFIRKEASAAGAFPGHGCVHRVDYYPPQSRT